uniref:Uncharacterized protein n=1 Tax=Arundo donax TaxID=35708 RepID=A0A0A9A2L4_ARUDO
MSVCKRRQTVCRTEHTWAVLMTSRRASILNLLALCDVDCVLALLIFPSYKVQLLLSHVKNVKHLSYRLQEHCPAGWMPHHVQ